MVNSSLSSIKVHKDSSRSKSPLCSDSVVPVVGSFSVIDSIPHDIPVESENYNPVTLGSVRYAYDSGMISRDSALAFYPKWVSTPSYAIFYRPNNYVGFLFGRHHYDCVYRVRKLSKRGNDVYRYNVRLKFKSLSDLCCVAQDHKFLDGRDGYSNLLFVTLTYDKKRCDEDSAWSNIGKELNLFLTKLRKEYGKIYLLRCFESFKTGYPHVHLILAFDDRKFHVVRRMAKRDKKYHYQVSNAVLGTIQRFWHSYVLVEGVRTLGAVGYILKYIQKGMYCSDNYKTIAKLWFYHKRSYDISRGFTPWLERTVECAIVQLDSIMRNSNTGVWNWKYLTTIIGNFEHDDWNFTILDDPPFHIGEDVRYDDDKAEVRRAFKEIV